MNYQEFYTAMNTNYYRADCYHTTKNPEQDATSGNMHVLNATYHLTSKKLDGYKDQVQVGKDFVKELRFLRSTQVNIGIYNRAPSKALDLESQDDYIGIMLSTDILKIPNYIRVHGKHYYNYYDNLNGKFKLTNWFGRFIYWNALTKRSANEKLNVFNRIGYATWLLSEIYFNKDKTNVSTKILQWLANNLMKGESTMVDWAIKQWEDEIKSMYSGQMGDVLGYYHGASHPFSLAMAGKI
jgi:hypothetical protein